MQNKLNSKGLLMTTKRDQENPADEKIVIRLVQAKKLELAAASASKIGLIEKVSKRKARKIVYGVGLPAPSKLKLSASKFAELAKAICS